jgi:hypothetical protein
MVLTVSSRPEQETVMADSLAVIEARQSLGELLAALRRAAGHTQETFAPLTHFGRSTLANVERGRQNVQRGFWVRCDGILGTGGTLVTEYDRIANLRAGHRGSLLTGSLGDGASLTREGSARRDRGASLRRAVLERGLVSGEHPVSLRELESSMENAINCYQAADYSSLGNLPELIGQAEGLAGDGSTEGERRGIRALAWVYLIVSKMAAKLGDGDLAWIAADRARSFALVYGDAALSGVVVYQSACALAKLPDRMSEAEGSAVTAAEDLACHAHRADPRFISVQGALLLHAAVVAARLGRVDDAHRRLARAADLAAQLNRDGNELWTAFGPANVALHRLSVAAALNRGHDALLIADRLDTSTISVRLVGRRAQMHLDLAMIHSGNGTADPQAVLHLLEYERIAPQAIMHNATAGRLIATLLRRERRSATPGLRALALRAGADL